MVFSHSFQAVVLHETAIFSGNGQTRPFALVERVEEALKWLKEANSPLFLITDTNPDLAQKKLASFGITEIFTHAGMSGIIQTHPHENPALKSNPHEPRVFYRPLLDRGITPSQCLSVVGIPAEIKSSLRTGISNILAYYGSPDVQFGETTSLKESFIRIYEGNTNLNGLGTMALYSEMPSLLWTMKPNRH